MNGGKILRDPLAMTPARRRPGRKQLRQHVERDARLIKIHGLQRSGTNYLTHLLNHNFKNVRCLVNLAGWKHGAYCLPWCTDRSTDVVVLVKNPYAWLVSVYSFWKPPKKLNLGPDLTNVPFDDFCRQRATFEANIPSVPFLYRAANPVQYWNNLNYHWCSIRNARLAVITYESLLYDAQSALVDLGARFDLDPVEGDVDDPSHDFVPGGELTIPAKEQWANRKWYEDKQYLSYYSPKLLEYVNGELDSELMRAFNYQYEGTQC